MSGAACLADFVDDPGAWADASLVAEHIAPGLQPDTARRLMASPRTGGRASLLLAEQLGRGDPASLDAADARLVLLSPAELEAIAWAAGAVWHGRRVRALLRGQEIAALSTRFTPQAREAALLYDPPERPPVSTGDLAADIERDGEACIAAWLTVLPAWAAARLRLVRAWPEASAEAASVGERAALVRRLGVAQP